MAAPRSVSLPTLPGIPTPHVIAQVAVGAEHSLAVTSTGLVFSWGSGTFGRLGSGSDTDRPAPQLVTALVPASLVAAVGGHEAADRTHALLDDDRVVSVTVSSSNSAAVTKHGRLFVWGAGAHGQLGDGGSAPAFRPQPVAVADGLSPVVAVALGDRHVLALTRGHDVWSWGANDAGQLGRATADRPDTEGHPVRVVPPTAGGWGADDTALHVACGTATSVVHTTAGRVWTWGAFDTKQLGRGETYDDEPVPKPVVFDEATMQAPVAALAVGQLHVICVLTTGQFVGWGFNVGDRPRLLPGLTLPPPRAIVAQWDAAAATTEGHTVLATGGEHLLFCS